MRSGFNIFPFITNFYRVRAKIKKILNVKTKCFWIHLPPPSLLPQNQTYHHNQTRARASERAQARADTIRDLARLSLRVSITVLN